MGHLLQMEQSEGSLSLPGGDQGDGATAVATSLGMKVKIPEKQNFVCCMCSFLL